MIAQNQISSKIVAAGTVFVASRIIPVTINYIPGMAVRILANWIADMPLNTRVRLFAKCSACDWVELINGQKVPGQPPETTPGAVEILIKTQLETSDPNVLPIVQSQTITISQLVTLSNLAYAVLADAGASTSDYKVSDELLNYPVPYAWLDQMTHRDALKKIVSACTGQCYQDRNGVIQIEGPDWAESRNVPVKVLTRDDYYNKNEPTSQVANYIEVYANPLAPATASEVYKSSEAEIIGVGGSKTVTCFYTEKPVINAVVSLLESPGVTITNVNYYAWGADVSVAGTAGLPFTILITGQILKPMGKHPAIAQDSASILENGKIVYILPDNDLIQIVEMAQKIADGLLTGNKDSRKDVSLNWRGDPALELGDRITVPQYGNKTKDYHIIRQDITWDGTLETKTDGKVAV